MRGLHDFEFGLHDHGWPFPHDGMPIGEDLRAPLLPLARCLRLTALFQKQWRAVVTQLSSPRCRRSGEGGDCRLVGFGRMQGQGNE